MMQVDDMVQCPEHVDPIMATHRGSKHINESGVVTRTPRITTSIKKFAIAKYTYHTGRLNPA